MTGIESSDSFIDKWRRRWPEWSVLAAFLPVAQRRPFWAWMALLQEVGDAAWGGGDPTPGLAKLAWWQEELRGWGRGARRHPLGEVLRKHDAPWESLALALAALPGSRTAASEGEDAAALQPLARAVLACEAALFGREGRYPEGAGEAALVAALRGERSLVQGDREAAQAGIGALPDRGLTRPRRLHAVLLRRRLDEFASGRGASRNAVGLLWAGWRAARES